MSQKKQVKQIRTVGHEIPETLADHVFYGLTLDEQQTKFRDAIYSNKNKAIFCNAKAGSGKTTIAVCTATLMVRLGIFSELVYLTGNGWAENRVGFLPGSLAEKQLPYQLPLHQALLVANEDPDRAIKADMDFGYNKDDDAFVRAIGNSYIRGLNIGSKDAPVICIIDESQNMNSIDLKTAITRINEGSKLVCIGHSGQNDLRDPSTSGFVPYLNHFAQKDWCEVCELTRNYRGDISSWADDL